MAKIINKVIEENQLEPIGVYLTGSRCLGLARDDSDWDVCILTEDTTETFVLHTDIFPKIDIFVRSKEQILNLWFAYCDRCPIRSLTYLYTFICYDELKMLIDDLPSLCGRVLRSTLHDVRFEKNYQYKVIAYQYLIYYYMRNGCNMDFDNTTWELIQRAHDKKLTYDEFISRKGEIEDYLSELDIEGGRFNENKEL